MRKIELLSPAKNLEYGKAAIDSGADAVYIGGRNFGARASAGNSLEDISQLVDYAHIFSSKVYVTLNTLFYDNEIIEVERFIHELYSIGVDAIIIQDMGVLELDLPPISIHASTQMHNFTKQRIDFLNKIGIERVILARELSLNQINNIHSCVPEIELEAFIHGALCSGLSGQCYLSLALTSRSGNRGVCAQPCRNRYTLLNDKGKILVRDKYLLSPMDLNASELIPDMLKAGISSFKIEGRLKDITYLKNITLYYREILDRSIRHYPLEYSRLSIGKIDYNFQPNPYKSFNRGFTDFYLKERNSKIGDINNPRAKGEYLGRIEQVKGVSFRLDRDINLENGDGLWYMDGDSQIQGFLVNGFDNGWIRPNKNLDLEISTKVFRNYDKAFEKLISSNRIKRSIGVEFILEESPKGFSLIAKDETGIRIEVYQDFEKTLAINLNSYNKNLLDQVSSLGQSPFYLISFIDNTKDSYFFPNSLIKSLRRMATQKLEKERIIRNRPTSREFKKNNYPYFQEELDYRANIINNKAIEFYTRHGVGNMEMGLDKTGDFKDKTLFSSRHCILYELGYCKKENNIPKDFDSQLYLQDNTRKFKLSFDCNNCLMNLE